MLKDEDELEFAVAVGLLTSSDARSIRATADNSHGGADRLLRLPAIRYGHR